MRGKEETLLKKGFPPSPAPPSSFLKLLFVGGAGLSEGHGRECCSLRRGKARGNGAENAVGEMMHGA